MHLDEFDAGALLQQFSGDMAERAIARITDRDLAGIGLGVIDQLFDVCCREVFLGRDQNRRLADQGNRRQIALRIVGHVFIDQLVVRRGPCVASSSV